MARPLDKEFEEADDTGVLDISGRNLRQFPTVGGDLLDFDYVFEADFSNNRFDKVPREVISFKALVKLNCHHNSIRWLPEELYLLVNLKEMNISRNFLNKFPGELCQMNLYSVNLNNNRLLSIPSEIGQLKNLQYLDLSCNMLVELPESFYTLTNLRHLNLHRNKLRDLSDDVCQLAELQYLDVSSNFLNRLPLSLRLMESLQFFSAEDNPLESPPPQVCVRGLVHLSKYLEVLGKKGSDPYLLASHQRDESLRRRKERINKKASQSILKSTPVPNGGDRELGLLDEMASLVNKTFGDQDGERTPTGSLHWSMAQYMNPEKSPAMSNQSKEEYREAAYRLYMQQEGHKGGKSTCDQTASSPTLSDSSTLSPASRKSDENVYRSSGGDTSRPTGFVGRSLSNEKFPRSGSWNSHMRISSPVLPSKYVSPSSEEKSQREPKSPPSLSSSKSAAELNVGKPTESSSSRMTSTPNLSTSKKRPPPLDTSTSHQNSGKGDDSDREGSLTPTNESPPPLDLSEDPTTPKDEKTFDELTVEKRDKPTNLDDIVANRSVSFSTVVEDIPQHRPLERRHSKPLPAPPPKAAKQPSRSASESDNGDVEIRELDSSPTTARRLPSLSEPEPVSPDNTEEKTSAEDGKWTRLASPRRKKEKDVFKFLKENDTNYTIRRQQMQINIMLEKHQHVKKAVENLLGTDLPDDLGEWIMDGVILCQVVNRLHPGTISIIHSPPPGQSLSRIKQTINISAFINACKTLKVPEEELCSAGDIIELKDPVRVITCVQRVLESKPGNLI